MDEAELFQLLPSEQKEVLAAAIGKRLQDIRRFFTLELSEFLEDQSVTAADFFVRNSGPTEFQFEGGLRHILNVWPSQLSIVVLPDLACNSQDVKAYRLSETNDVTPEIKSYLGRTCRDVRIWIYLEGFESDEAKQVAVSYVFEDDLELFYCMYLHGDGDTDYLLLGSDVPRERVKKCISLAAENAEPE